MRLKRGTPSSSGKFFRMWGGSLRYLHSLTLRSRLWLIFSAFVLLSITFAVGVLYVQHEVAVRGADATVREYSELEKAIEVREALANLNRSVEIHEVSPERITRVRRGLESLLESESLRSETQLLQRAEEQFEQYASRIAEMGVGPSRPTFQQNQELQRVYEEVAASVESYIDGEQDTMYQLAYQTRQRQEKTVKAALGMLAIFVALVWLGAFRIISVVTHPLSALAGFLDSIHLEDGLVNIVPHFKYEVPEVNRVARSFEHLLYRLRGYQALNVRRLLMEKRRADIIAASISDGIFLLRGEEILYVNPVGERILGLPSDRPWKGLHLVESVRTKGSQAVFNAANRTIPVEFEVQYEGRRAFYLLQSFAISDELIERIEHSFEGPIDQLLDRWQANTLVVARDVTLVKESQDAKSHFIATLSHEVKTPVTSLTMATRLLKKSVDQVPNPTHRALIETCAEDVDRLRVLIDDLLSVSRFDTLTQRLELKSVDIAKLLKQSVQHFQPQAFERGVEIVTRLPARRPLLVSMDATKISWALSNLLINALRHTTRGGKVEAVLELREDEDSVEVRIRDHGPGIDRGRQERIFDKFNPFYDIRVARSGALGMGLAIAREIVMAHGGRIWVVSEPGKGAEFCFSLPVKGRQVSDPGLRTGGAHEVSNNFSSSNQSSSKGLKGETSGASARS